MTQMLKNLFPNGKNMKQKKSTITKFSFFLLLSRSSFCFDDYYFSPAGKKNLINITPTPTITPTPIVTLGPTEFFKSKNVSH